MQTTYHASSPFMHQSSLSSRTPREILRTVTVIATMLTLFLTLAPPAAAAPPVVAPPEIVPFERWAPEACPRPTGEEPAAVSRLVVHHTHEPVAHTSEEVVPALALTCKAHTDRGFSTIGYHYVVDPWGGVWQGRGGMPDAEGRPPAAHGQGAHVAGSNSGAVGVVFLGDHAGAPPTAAAMASATQLLAWLIQDTDIDPGALVPTNSSGVGTARFVGTFTPRAVTGHSASNHTECPGEHLRALLGDIRNQMRELLAGTEASGWEGLAVAPPAPGAAPQPPPAPAPAKPAPVEKAPATDAPAKEQAAAPATDDSAEADEANELTLPTPLAPLVSPVERVAGTLRTVGLLSLAERLGGNGEG